MHTYALYMAFLTIYQLIDPEKLFKSYMILNIQLKHAILRKGTLSSSTIFENLFAVRPQQRFTFQKEIIDANVNALLKTYCLLQQYFTQVKNTRCHFKQAKPKNTPTYLFYCQSKFREIWINASRTQKDMIHRRFNEISHTEA